jgi:hypothetical protein
MPPVTETPCTTPWMMLGTYMAMMKTTTEMPAIASVVMNWSPSRRRRLGEADQHLGADARDHHQRHQLHADRERIDEIADGKILGEARAAEAEHDHAGEQADIHLDHDGDEDRGDQAEGDDDDDHGEHGGDRQRIVLEQAELRLLRHLRLRRRGRH